MRIIAGIARGMTIVVPRGDNMRPTSDRVREAVFSSLGERVTGARVLDLYAGTGALGLEALSRGATAAVFVEQARAVVVALRANVAEFARRDGGTERAQVRTGDVFEQLKRLAAEGAQFELVLADPPYGPVGQELLSTPSLAAVLAPGGMLVLETAARDALEPPAGWELRREAVYGDTRVTFWGRARCHDGDGEA